MDASQARCGRFVLTAVGIVSTIVAASAAAKNKPTPCPPNRYVVQGKPLLPSAPPSEVDVIQLAAPTGAISFGCTVADLTRPVTSTARKTFTRVRAVWHGCTGVPGSIRLVGAKIVDRCTTLTGTLRAKHVHTAFTARLSTCGDGFVDTGAGEECDRGRACSAGTCTNTCVCSDSTTTTSTQTGSTTTTTTTQTGTTTTTQSVVSARPYHSVVPASYVSGTPTPLVIMLHGYAASATVENIYLGLSGNAEAKGFLYAFPDGTVDSAGQEFWNATDACCDLDGSHVDDVAYLDAVIDDMAARFTVDPKRVYVVGHSNGGFMAYRLACDLASKVAGIVSLGGATWNDPSRCQPTQPVSVIEIHGTNDASVAYGGGSLSAAFPSAPTTAATWAGYDGCSPSPAAESSIDLDSTLAGAETTVSAYSGCQQNSAVQLWSIQGGSHVPTLTATWFDPVWVFLQAHARP